MQFCKLVEVAVISAPTSYLEDLLNAVTLLLHKSSLQHIQTHGRVLLDLVFTCKYTSQIVGFCFALLRLEWPFCKSILANYLLR